jgi:hypothetical protein
VALPSGAQVFASDDSHLVALWRNVFITAWWGETTVARLKNVGVVQKDVVRRLPNGFVALALITASNTNMPADVRAEAEKLSREPPPQLRAIAQVIHGVGFSAAAIRALASGMQLMGGGKSPSKIFNTLDSAATWLSPRMNALLTPPASFGVHDLTAAARALVADSASRSGAAVLAPW